MSVQQFSIFDTDAVKWVLETWGKLHASEKLIMLYFALHCEPVEGGGWTSTPRLSEIIEWTGVSARHTQLCLTQLLDAGVLAREEISPLGTAARWTYTFG